MLNRRHIRGFGLPQQFTPFCLRKSTAIRAHCGRALSSWNSKFPPMRWANRTPLDVKFDQRNVGRLSYLIRPLIPSFGRPWCRPRPWHCHQAYTYHAAGLLQASPKPSSKHVVDHWLCSNSILIHWRTWYRQWRCCRPMMTLFPLIPKAFMCPCQMHIFEWTSCFKPHRWLRKSNFHGTLNVSLHSGSEMNRFLYQMTKIP